MVFYRPCKPSRASLWLACLLTSKPRCGLHACGKLHACQQARHSLWQACQQATPRGTNASLPHGEQTGLPRGVQALDTFNTAIVSPIYYVMFTTLTILASVIMFKDWDGQNIGNIVSEICGFVVVLSGTILLQVTKDNDRNASRSVYAPLSPRLPSLTTRLCSGNGDLLKHVEEDMTFSEDALLRRQELY
ncbi:hypothetical protein ZIOFF_020967 [Zingiber officinale]|uniref:Probable magnesium transporter n=1 Tax=Zingiber officinale TaxID=94328 RepID=A0A8J5GZL4_ZINOF|nr:hypothetical protein ZIOFF_020967 [Zingiber officinale]